MSYQFMCCIFMSGIFSHPIFTIYYILQFLTLSVLLSYSFLIQFSIFALTNISLRCCSWRSFIRVPLGVVSNERCKSQFSYPEQERWLDCWLTACRAYTMPSRVSPPHLTPRGAGAVCEVLCRQPDQVILYHTKCWGEFPHQPFGNC